MQFGYVRLGILLSERIKMLCAQDQRPHNSFVYECNSLFSGNDSDVQYKRDNTLNGTRIYSRVCCAFNLSDVPVREYRAGIY